MRKIFLVLFVCFFAYGTALAQAIEYGDQAVNVGIGIGGADIYGDGLPSVNFSYELLPIEKIGIGYISVGGFGSYKHSNYDAYGWETKYNYWIIGGRAAYHFDFYTMNRNDFFNYFDVYAGVMGGVKIQNGKEDGHYNESPYYDEHARHDDLDETKPIVDVFAGCRYNFSENLGAFAETSVNGNSFLRIGVSFLF